MKILLIQPPSCDPMTDQIFLFEPLALEYLGAGLKLDGHQVELLDARLEPDFEPVCRRFQPDLVGLTGFTSHVNINSIIDTSRILTSHGGINYITIQDMSRPITSHLDINSAAPAAARTHISWSVTMSANTKTTRMPDGVKW